MTGKEAIIHKIIEDAESYRDSERSAVDERVAEMRNTTEKYEADCRSVSLKKSEVESVAVIARMRTVAELQVRKITLARKQELIAETFESAKEQILQLPLPSYKQFLKNIIAKCAEDGEMVVLGKRDSQRFTAGDIEALGKECGVKLSLSPNEGEFDGGLILSNANCDKNLTLDTILRLSRERVMGKVADILFK